MHELTLPSEQAIIGYIKDLYAQGLRLAKTKNELHAFLQKTITELASKFSLTPNKEYVLPKFRGDRDGRIDVVWSIGLIPIVSFEIDSVRRTKSLKKLLASNSNLKFWIYYGVSPFESFVKSIDPTSRIKVVHFPTRFDKSGLKSETVYAIEVSRNESISNKSYSFPEIRIKYPNAYEKWSDEQEEFLKDSFLNGLAVSEIAKSLQRKPGAIRSRFKKLGLR